MSETQQAPASSRLIKDLTFSRRVVGGALTSLTTELLEFTRPYQEAIVYTPKPPEDLGPDDWRYRSRIYLTRPDQVKRCARYLGSLPVQEYYEQLLYRVPSLGTRKAINVSPPEEPPTKGKGTLITLEPDHPYDTMLDQEIHDIWGTLSELAAIPKSKIRLFNYAPALRLAFLPDSIPESAVFEIDHFVRSYFQKGSMGVQLLAGIPKEKQKRVLGTQA